MKKNFCVVLAVMMFCVITDFTQASAANTNSGEVIELTAAHILRENNKGPENRRALVERIFRKRVRVSGIVVEKPKFFGLAWVVAMGDKSQGSGEVLFTID